LVEAKTSEFTFAVLSLLLAMVGLYGVMSYLVGQRTREIGIRMAVGTERADVLRLIMRQGIRLTLAGAILGLLTAMALTRSMSSLLYGVNAMDPLTFGYTAVLIAPVAPAAYYIPARRATKIDPMLALRCE
jgi:putative ABC transport system permease protein